MTGLGPPLSLIPASMFRGGFVNGVWSLAGLRPPLGLTPVSRFLTYLEPPLTLIPERRFLLCPAPFTLTPGGSIGTLFAGFGLPDTLTSNSDNLN